MEKSINIALVQTPYHLMVFEKLLETDRFKNSDWVIYCSSIVKSEIQNKFNFDNIIEIDFLELSIKKEFLFKLKNFVEIRKSIKAFRANLNSLIVSNTVKNYVLFSEKNLVSQLILNDLEPITLVWGVDEGTGHYRSNSNLDYIRKLMYKIATPILIGFKYEYFKVLGSHKRIDNLLLRIPVSSNSKKVYSFLDLGVLASRKNLKSHLLLNQVLILTGPYSEDGKINEKIELIVYNDIIDILDANGYEIKLKPHPRENVVKYKDLAPSRNIEIMDQKTNSELLNYFEYDLIISFYSSSIIDIIGSGYNSKRVINIDLIGKIELEKVFGQTHELRKNNLDAIVKILKSNSIATT